MNHSWMLNGVKCNFCTKCGIKQSRSYYKHCHMHNSSVTRYLEHKIDSLVYEDGSPLFRKKYNDHNESFFVEAKVCSACDLSNRRYGNFCIDFSKDDGYAYVTYYASTGKNGKKKYVYFDSSYRRVLVDKIGNPLHLNFLKIYCPYNEDELLIKDIVI